MSRALVPPASVPTRLLLAAAVWTIVGSGLLAAGLRWLAASGTLRGGLPLAAAVVVGTLKARFVLVPRARDNASRIETAGPRRCIVEIYSWPTWTFVAGMIGFGALLRRGGLPLPLLGWIYATVGWALLLASCTSWRIWAARR